jgi:anti-anti-sigma regulatory factor
VEPVNRSIRPHHVHASRQLFASHPDPAAAEAAGQPVLVVSVWFGADGSCHLAVAGEIDFGTVSRVSEALEWATGHCDGDVRLHLAKVTFAGARFVNELVSTYARLAEAGRRLRLEQVPAKLARLVRLCNTGYLLDADPDIPSRRGPRTAEKWTCSARPER